MKLYFCTRASLLLRTNHSVPTGTNKEGKVGKWRTRDPSGGGDEGVVHHGSRGRTDQIVFTNRIAGIESPPRSRIFLHVSSTDMFLPSHQTLCYQYGSSSSVKFQGHFSHKYVEVFMYLEK